MKNFLIFPFMLIIIALASCNNNFDEVVISESNNSEIQNIKNDIAKEVAKRVALRC